MHSLFIKPSAALSILCLANSAFAQDAAPAVPTFPGAEGYGSVTRGGRGGKVIAVTNLNESGPGSLRAALEAEGPRIVVFRVAGTIDGDFEIKNGHITIAGQTAPGDGIAIKGRLGIKADDVVVRYIRVRGEAKDDAVGSRGHKNIMIDHLSASWSSDEILSIYQCQNYTIQWSMVTEACSEGHKFGGIWGGNHSSHHHNLLAHNASRNPRWASGCQNVDYRNNVVYNWGKNSTYGAEANEPRGGSSHFSNVNMVANYYKAGPATSPNITNRIADPSTRKGEADAGKWWLADNYVVGHPEVTADNWKGFSKPDPYFRLEKAWPAMPINQQTAEEAYKSVLETVGCSMPRRDSVDTRIIEEVRKGTFTHGDKGLITVPADVGGCPKLEGGPAPADSDEDGMPDDWEKKHGFDPANGSDASPDQDKDGYPNIEEYLNGTDPKQFVDYTKPQNNVNTLR